MKKRNYELYALILILVFAFFLRVWSLSSAGLWIDESTSAVASRMIVEKVWINVKQMFIHMFRSKSGKMSDVQTKGQIKD